jgi:hypothetical protein
VGFLVWKYTIWQPCFPLGNAHSPQINQGVKDILKTSQISMEDIQYN